jgi:NAD(P)-dependent dehydrogenase (short-subunit alcohol dehydrogenase family)
MASRRLFHDVCDEAAWARVITDVTDRFGGLHGLVNNAGVGTPPHDPETTTLDQWQRMIDINLKSVFLGTRAAIPLMRASGGGSIVNLSSIHGLTGAPRASAYGAAKGGVRSYTKATALHCGRTGSNIRANSLHPGFIETPMLVDAFRARGEETVQRAIAMAQVPLGRTGSPDDVAQAILFLISDESSYITGVELPVDGGYTAA